MTTATTTSITTTASTTSSVIPIVTSVVTTTASSRPPHPTSGSPSSFSPFVNPGVMFPLHEVIAQLRHNDGTTDVREFLGRFQTDILTFGLSPQWAVGNFDRVLDNDAKLWFAAQWPAIERRNRETAPLTDLSDLWDDIQVSMSNFFDHTSQKATYRQKNRDLRYSAGRDAQSYVTQKLQILRYIDSNMSDDRIVEQLIKGLPYDVRQNMILQSIPNADVFIHKLRKVADLYHECKADRIREPRSSQRSSFATSSSVQPSLNQLQRNRNDDRPKGSANRTPDGVVICDYCYKVGHTKRLCRKRLKHQGQQSNGNNDPRSGNTNNNNSSSNVTNVHPNPHYNPNNNANRTTNFRNYGNPRPNCNNNGPSNRIPQNSVAGNGQVVMENYPV